MVQKTLNKKRIGIVGLGYVGKAMESLFRDRYEVRIYDHAYEKYSSKESVNGCDIVFICVPTPQKEDGSCDTSIVTEIVSWIESDIIVIKSTVPPGTTDYLARKFDKNIVFSPEYCGESTYWTPYEFHTDIKETPFFIFGGERQFTSQLVDLFLRVTGPVKTYRQTTARSAEMAKYMANTFFATKIAYCYEIAQICEKSGMDFNEIRELWLLDPRINPMHTAVFKANSKPFSGKCLPKDLSALIAFAKNADYNPTLLSEVKESNERIGKCLSESHQS